MSTERLNQFIEKLKNYKSQEIRIIKNKFPLYEHKMQKSKKIQKIDALITHIENYCNKHDANINMHDKNSSFYKKDIERVADLLEQIDRKFQNKTLHKIDFQLPSLVINYQVTDQDKREAKFNTLNQFVTVGAMTGAVILGSIAGIISAVLFFTVGLAETAKNPIGVIAAIAIITIVCALVGAAIGALIGLIAGGIYIAVADDPQDVPYKNAFDCTILKACYAEFDMSHSKNNTLFSLETPMPLIKESSDNSPHLPEEVFITDTMNNAG